MTDPTWHVATAALLAALCSDLPEAREVKSRLGELTTPESWETAWEQVVRIRDEIRAKVGMS